MKSAVIADIHGNIIALETVLRHIGRKNVDQIFSLGDVVGYGPAPKACLEIIQSRNIHSIIGNHEEYILGTRNKSEFNDFARTSLEYAKSQLDEKDIEFIGRLEPAFVSDDKSYKMTHDPVVRMENYFFQQRKTGNTLFEHDDQIICFVGHTHKSALFELDPSKRTVKAKYIKEESCCSLDLAGGKFVVNAGSVGQPRDKNPEAAYVIFDDTQNTLNFYRVAYDIESVKKQMLEKNLPDYLINRLSYGN